MRQFFKGLPLFLLILVSACFITSQVTYRNTDVLWQENVANMIHTDTTRINSNLSYTQTVVFSDYMSQPSEDRIVDGVMNGYINGLGDRYAMYLNKNGYNNYIKSTSAATNVGIGVNIIHDNSVDGVYIVDVYDGSPAQNAGIVPGDIITHIDGTSVKSMGFYDVVAILGDGDVSDALAISVRKRSGESYTTLVERAPVEVEAVTSKKMGNSIGLITIEYFDGEIKDKFVRNMEKLIASGCEKFIVDIRNNGGGSLDGAAAILDFLLPSGNLVTVTDKSGTKNTMSSDVNESPYAFAVLVNRGTVCEAEMFAVAMKNLGDAVIIGETTYGKSSLQSMFLLPDGGAVCFTTAAYIYSGEESQKAGVEPDIQVSLSAEAYERFGRLDDSEDEQLQEAINYLKSAKADLPKD